jgi:hypothetical protein
MTDMTRNYELVEGLHCELDFEFCSDGTMDSAFITSIKLPDGTWLALPAPILVYTDKLAEFAQTELAERSADWAAEERFGEDY